MSEEYYNEDYSELPRNEDVTGIDFGTMKGYFVTVTPENRDYLVGVAMSMYLNEPCRICGKLIQEEDLYDLRYAGYGQYGRAAHNDCWEENIPQSKWYDSEDQ